MIFAVTAKERSESMGDKYIIEKHEKDSIWRMYADAYGDVTIEGVDLTPYTEPDLEQVRKEAYEQGYKECLSEHDFDSPCVSCDEYKRGLADAWEAARKIASDNAGRNYSIFGQHFTVEILNTHSASECIEKIKQYEQRQEEQIQVGDEVVGTYTGEEETEPFVIIRKIPEIYPNYYFGIYSKSGEFCQGGLKLKKTGRHFPEIAEVLEKMKEEE